MLFEQRDVHIFKKLGALNPYGYNILLIYSLKVKKNKYLVSSTITHAQISEDFPLLGILILLSTYCYCFYSEPKIQNPVIFSDQSLIRTTVLFFNYNISYSTSITGFGIHVYSIVSSNQLLYINTFFFITYS
jgi:hypothetical protein